MAPIKRGRLRASFGRFLYNGSACASTHTWARKSAQPLDPHAHGTSTAGLDRGLHWPRPMPLPSDSEQDSAGNPPSVWRLIAEDYAAHGRDVLRPGFQALLV